MTDLEKEQLIQKNLPSIRKHVRTCKNAVPLSSPYAEDMHQELCLKLLEKAEKENDPNATITHFDSIRINRKTIAKCAGFSEYNNIAQKILSTQVKSLSLSDEICERIEDSRQHSEIEDSVSRIAFEQFLQTRTPAIRTILNKKLQGFTNREIADSLHMKLDTVQKYVKRESKRYHDFINQ